MSRTEAVPVRTEATIKTHKAYGSVWNAGDLIAGWEPPAWPRQHGRYSVLLCTKAREVGARGGVRAPAESAEIVGPSWAAVCRAIQSLGFSRPTLTAAEVREGYRSPRRNQRRGTPLESIGAAHASAAKP